MGHDPTLNHEILDGIGALPPGGYALGLSGHLDSTALLRLMILHRPDCQLHLVHLDHQLRGAESHADADFAAELARRHALPFTCARLRDLEANASHPLPVNLSARWRALRHDLYRQAVNQHALAGVLLAHHADDQAETILQRLLRGSSPGGLVGMAAHTQIAGLAIHRPLLAAKKADLRAFLLSIGGAWREDSSNASDKYQRNRVRQFLTENPDWSEPLIELGRACRELRDAVRHAAPILGPSFSPGELLGSPDILAEESARRWLLDRGISPAEMTSDLVTRLMEMAADAATPPRQDFPDGITVRRHSGRITANQRT